jgi:hypothetical protein
MAFIGGILLMAAGIISLVGSLLLFAPPVPLGVSLVIFFVGMWFAQVGL